MISIIVCVNILTSVVVEPITSLCEFYTRVCEKSITSGVDLYN